MPSVKINDAELYYEVHGSGFPLVLSHSGRTSLNNFDANIPVLSQHYQVVAYDRRGCERSKAPENSDSPQAWVEDLHALLEHLNIDRAYIGGVSYGAMLSVEFLFAYPKMVEAVISACGSPFGWGHDRPNAIPFPDRRSDLGSVTTPVLWIYGEEDAGFPPSMGEEARKLTPGSELVVIPAVGHSPQVDTPDAFNQSILKFLSDAPSPTWLKL